MQSLRSRKSQAPPRKVQRSGTKLSKPGTSISRKKSQSSKVDDKIKKRMSMRYADISSPTEVNVPAIPSVPAALQPGGGPRARMGEESVRQRVEYGEEEVRAAADDNKLLDKTDFDPDEFLKRKLANSTEAELRSLQSSLRDAKDGTAADLQRNVFKNYAEFVLISKEISTLENELLELKESLSDYKTMPASLHIPDPSSNTAALSSYRRSSVADLRIHYYNQMQTLHAEIEGSAKFVPNTPGRHIVSETDSVQVLNIATYKSMGKAKFVVLDDSVLVAKRRRRAGGESKGASKEGKLVAERCWPLNEMLVLDTKDSASMTNVFKIRHGKETFVYRTDTPSDKKSLLAQIRHVAEELSAKKRKEREGEHERRKTLWTGGERGSVLNMDWMSELARSAGETSAGTEAKQKAEKDAQYAAEWADDLTVAIALKEWAKATSLVQEGKGKVAINQPLASKLPNLTTHLITSLLECLSRTSNRKSSVVFLISLLLRLGAGPAARMTFLDMRTEVIKDYVKKIPFGGHVGAYIGDLAIVYFTGIKHTADWFLAGFKENEVSSAMIEWARKQIESYAAIFRRQVYIADTDPHVIEEAMKITYSQSRKLLEDFGLDFRFLLENVLSEKPKEINSSSRPFSFEENHVVKPATTLRTPSTPSRRQRSPAPPIPSLSVSASSPGASSASTVVPSALQPQPLSAALSSASAYTPLSAVSRSRSPVAISTPDTPPIPPLPPSPSPSAARSARTRTPPPRTPPLTAPLPPPPPSPSISRSSARTPPPAPASASPLRPSVGSLRSERSLRGPRSAGLPTASALGSRMSSMSSMSGTSTESPPPPPRSAHRPNSSSGSRIPPVPQRQGMI